MDLKEEKRLVEEAKHSKKAFSKLYDAYYSAIYRYALRRTANVPLSLDITSEVFFQALKHIQKFDWRDIRFSSWLYRIASNKIHDGYRKNRYTSLSLDVLLAENDFEPASSEDIEQELMDAEENLQRHQTFLEIQKEISSLDILYQDVITLRYFENKKVKEIAQILGKSEGTIKSQLSRGLKKLQQSVTKVESKKKLVKNTVQPIDTLHVLPVEVKNYE